MEDCLNQGVTNNVILKHRDQAFNAGFEEGKTQAENKALTAAALKASDTARSLTGLKTDAYIDGYNKGREVESSYRDDH